MAKNNIFKSKLFYFVSLVLLIYISCSVQSNFLAQIGSEWFHIDLVSIIIVYLCFEHQVMFAATQAVLAGALLQLCSSSTLAFFILYFMIIVVFSNIIKSFFVIKSLFSKVIIFSFLYAIKYLLFYFSLSNRHEIGVLTLALAYWKGFFMTAIAFFFIYQLLMRFDFMFIPPGTISSGKSYGR